MPSPPESSDDVLDLLVIGGGVMGLFTAYQGSREHDRVAVLERGRIGDPATASYGRTRSYRRDYLEAMYTRFADEAIRLWTEFETQTGAEVLVRCGCMNIAKTSVTPDLETTYAHLSTDVLRRLGQQQSKKWPHHDRSPNDRVIGHEPERSSHRLSISAGNSSTKECRCDRPSLRLSPSYA
jgi:glycine/D-amino acid oxidase-like deaminating enzyme